MHADPPFEPTAPNPIVRAMLGFDGVRPIAEKAAAFAAGEAVAEGDLTPPHPGTPEGFATLADYCRRHRINVPAKLRKGVAHQLIQMTWTAGLDVASVPDPRFGKLNCYPLVVLDEWQRRLMRKRAKFRR